VYLRPCRNTYCQLPLPFILVSVLLTVIPGRSELPSQALSQFLAGQVAPDRHQFGEIRMTRANVAEWLQKLRMAKQPQERGIAVANLQNCAWVLLDTPETLPVALEILNQWVVPNATLMRALPRTSACSWENTIQGAYASYQKAGDPQGERRVLELLSTQARDPGLRDLAILRLASLKADQGNLKEAIDIARKSDSRGEFFEHRARLLELWQQELKAKKTR
jgi:hypothetical protein